MRWRLGFPVRRRARSADYALLAAVAWLKVSGLRHAQRFEVPASVDGHRLDDHAHVVAALIEQRGAPGSKPMRALLKHRHLARA